MSQKMCNCKDFMDGMNQLNSFLVLGVIHGMNCTIQQFNFCPWCGKKLIEHNIPNPKYFIVSNEENKNVKTKSE